ncbi:MAG TPA: YfiR family protein [Candidatus Angelobacter sp.]|nr:YfiR family protein [Candidatus Angelobacter sp.]
MLAGQTNHPTEYQVEAAYLLNFGKFVTWPAEISSQRKSFGLCVLGPDPFGRVLVQTVSGETLDGKPVITKHIASISQSAGCAVVFVAVSEQRRLRVLLPALANRHILTVSDIPHFVDHGGAIGFVIDDSHVRFEVNQSAAQDAGLRLSSELLKVAVSVKKASAKGGR